MGEGQRKSELIHVNQARQRQRQRQGKKILRAKMQLKRAASPKSKYEVTKREEMGRRRRRRWEKSEKSEASCIKPAGWETA